MATNNSNQAQQLQQQAMTSSPGADSTFSGGTLGSLSEDPVTQAQAASEQEQQSKLLTEAGKIGKKADVWWKRSTVTYGKLVELPAFANNDLAATVWLNYGSAAQAASDAPTGDQGLRGVPQDRAGRRQRAAGQDGPEAAQGIREGGRRLGERDAVIDIETTPGGATLVSVNEPLDYGVVADLAEVLASDSVRESHHIVIELSPPGSMDETAVGVLVRSARDARLRGGRLTLCGADERVARCARAHRRLPPRAARRRRRQRARLRPHRLTRASLVLSRTRGR